MQENSVKRNEQEGVMSRWEEYVEDITSTSRMHGKALGILKNVSVRDNEKLIMAQVRMDNPMSIEIFLQSQPFNFDEHFKDYDIVITSVPDIEDREDRGNYLSYARAIYTFIITNFKQKGTLSERDMDTFAIIGIDLTRVGISIEEIYELSEAICKDIGFPFDDITVKAQNRAIDRGGPDFSDIVEALMAMLGVGIKNE